MDFDLSEEQRLIDASLRSMLADQLPLERLREICDGGRGFDAGLWASLKGLGLPGLIIAEEFGGAGLGLLDAAVVAEALGHAALPGPFLSALVMAPLAVSRQGDQKQKLEVLPQMATGDLRAALAFETAPGTNLDSGLRQTGNRLSGQLNAVLDAGGASHVLIQRADGSASLLDLNQAGVAIHHRVALDRGRPLADISLEDVACMALTSGADGTGPQILQAGRVMLAADTLGAMQYMFDAAVAYAKERQQFGRVIGSFQSVKHVCAEMAAMLEPCRALVWYAAHAQDALLEEAPEEAAALAHHTQAHLAEVGREVARLATETHGGMGFTDLLGLHIWFKRIGQNRQLLGTPEHCRRDAARCQGWIAA